MSNEALKPTTDSPFCSALDLHPWPAVAQFLRPAFLRIWKMKLLSSLVLTCFLLSACSDLPQTSWTKADVTGLWIELIDPVTVESMSFHSEGFVPLTLGEKNGPVTGPVLNWEFVDGRIRITTDDNQQYDEFTLIERDSKTITVRRSNGKIAKYRIRRT